MGLIKAALGAAGGVMADQWKEYFYCEAIPADVLAVKGQKKVTGRSSNRRGDDNIITNGSVIAVAGGQCMLIVEQGKVVDVCAEPGEYTYDMSTEPGIFSGDLGDSVKSVFQNIGKRFTFGGEAPKDQRIYYFNTKELTGNKYGTPSPVPFRVVDQRAGIDLDIGIRCFGEYSIRLKNPLLFYTNVCGNEINADANTNLSLFIGAVLSVTGVALGTGIAAGIIRFVGGVVSGGTITKGAHGYFSGTQYDYNLGAENRAVSPIVRRTYNGKAFNGNTRVADQAWKKGQKVYEGYYPQFIRQKDTTVAGWIFNDFFSGTYDVYKWSSLI